MTLWMYSCGNPNRQFEPVSNANYEQGLRALLKKDYLSAEREFKKAIEQNDRHVAAYSALGDVYLNWCRYDDAKRHYHRALKIDHNFVQSYLGLAKLQLAQNNYKEAKLLLEEALQITKNDAEIHYLLGLLYIESKQNEQALTEFQKSLDLDPRHAAAQLKMRELQQERFNSSSEHLDLSIKRAVSRAEMAYFLIQRYKLSTDRTVSKIPIDDIQRHIAAEEIQQIVDLQFMEVINGKFYPDKLVTRRDLAKIGEGILVFNSGDQSLKTDFQKTTSPFTDLSPNDTHYNAIILSTSYGLFDSMTDGKFHPYSTVTGSEVIQFFKCLKSFIGD